MMAYEIEFADTPGGKKNPPGKDSESRDSESRHQDPPSTFDAIGHFTFDRLNDLIRDFMDRADDALFERSEKAGSEKDRKLYFDAMREIRIKRVALQERFDNQMQRSLANLARNGGRPCTGDDEDSTAIGIERSEDRIAIDNLISRSRQQFAEDLLPVTGHLQKLLDLKQLRQHENPLDPEAICENFHIACELLEVDIQARLIFYKLFEKQIMAELGGVYRDLAKRLSQPGLPPDCSKRKPASKQRAGAGKKTPTAPPGDSRSIIEALTRLQQDPDINRPPESTTPAKLRQSIHKRLDALWHDTRRSLSNDDSQRIDAVLMLFDFFFDEEALPASVKILIGRLQIPILKVTLLDRQFLTQKNHPARKLLDRMSRAALACDENHQDTRALIARIEEITDSIVTRFGDDIAIFEQASIEFETFVGHEEKKRERSEARLRKQEQQREQRVRAAREATGKFVNKLVHNRDLNPDIVDFLMTTWTSVLFNTYLSLGESSRHWHNLRRISKTLVWTLIPRHSEAERSRIVKTIPALLRALARGMALINTDMKAQNRIFALLAREHARIVKQTSRNIVTRVDDTTVWPEDAAENAFARAADIENGEPENVYVDDESGDMVLNAEDTDDDAVTFIDQIEPNDVINDLNQFTAGVRQGKIRIEEEIVLAGGDDEDFEMMDQNDEFLEQARKLKAGDWVEFVRTDVSRQVLNLSWKSKTTGDMVFVNGNGNKVRNMSLYDLANELRTERARCIEMSSALDRAFYKITTKLQH